MVSYENNIDSEFFSNLIHHLWCLYVHKILYFVLKCLYYFY